MALTTDQIAGLAPDASGAAAGRKLAAAKHWEGLGRSNAAAWGLCKGSAVYQVKADLANFGYHCSCPSRKFPCKHALGLLLLLAEAEAEFAFAAPPDWMLEWLSRREARAVEQAEKAEAEAKAEPLDETAQRKRTEKRESRVREGLDRLDVWLRDLVRNGLADAETKPASFWEEAAKRLVDAQAPGLARRVARLAELPGDSPDWPERLLAELGLLSLALHAYRRIDSLDAGLACDLRQYIGWAITTEEVDGGGERVADDWLLIGQYVEDDGRVRAQRTWAVGEATGRAALLLQFAAGAAPFAEPVVPGVRQRGTIAFYPGAGKQRAKFLLRGGPPEPLTGRPTCGASIGGFLEGVAEATARQPWLSNFGGVLRGVTVIPGEAWHVRDAAGDSLPLTGSDDWRLLALTGGHPADVAGEWDGRRFRPLGLFVDGVFRTA